jgi:catechol 2,3-dioxygenase-like lactoylglutathione lyase family enzyme
MTKVEPLHGLSHIALAVRDLDRTVDFYTRAFGVREYYRDSGSAQVLGPGPYDVLAFEVDPDRAGKAGGAIHFGFRLTHSGAIDAALAAVEAAGGRLKERGDFGAGQPFAFVEDPDGYEIELWYEDTPPHSVAPAKAGVPGQENAAANPAGMPAFAGMTKG